MAKSTVTWKLAKGKTWRQKLETAHPNHGKIVAVPPRMRKRFGGGTMVIPRPLDVDALMRSAPKGRLISQSQIREQLARQAGADQACPLTTGIFIRIVAEAAEEDLRAGKRRVTPYWRTIKDDGGLCAKFPGGVEEHARRLRREGFSIRRTGGQRSSRVEDFERFLVKV
jgi:hypothetical protein